MTVPGALARRAGITRQRPCQRTPVRLAHGRTPKHQVVIGAITLLSNVLAFCIEVLAYLIGHKKRPAHWAKLPPAAPVLYAVRAHRLPRCIPIATRGAI